jgi:hypothetical protein
MEYATYRYTVQASGVYYIHLTAGMYTQATQSRWSYWLTVWPVSTSTVRLPSIAYYDSRGRAIILRLNEGDELRVRVPSGGNYYLYSNTIDYTTFSGFRLYDF